MRLVYWHSPPVIARVFADEVNLFRSPFVVALATTVRLVFSNFLEHREMLPSSAGLSIDGVADGLLLA